MGSARAGSFRKPDDYEVPGIGVATIRPITLGAYSEADKRADDVPDEQRGLVFTRHILLSLIQEPTLTLDDVADFSQETTDALILIAADTSGVRDDYERTSPELPSPDRLYRAFRLRKEEQAKGIFRSLTDIYDHMSEMAATASKLHDRIGSDATEQARALARALDIQHKAMPIETLSAMPDLGERFAAFSSMTQALAAQSAVQGSAALEALRMVDKIKLPDLAKQFAAINLPEPLLSDSLLASGLNAPFLHSPTYALPEVVPIHSEDELIVREKETRRRRLVDAYDILSELEQVVRGLIESGLRGLHGDHWWKRGVPDNIRRQCEERKQAKEKLGEPAYDPLTYAYFDDYRAIITKADNWKSVFGSVFGDKEEFQVCMKWVNQARDPIAHCRPIEDLDYGTFVTAASVLQSAILRNKGQSS